MNEEYLTFSSLLEERECILYITPEQNVTLNFQFLYLSLGEQCQSESPLTITAYPSGDMAGPFCDIGNDNPNSCPADYGNQTFQLSGESFMLNFTVTNSTYGQKDFLLFFQGNVAAHD